MKEAKTIGIVGAKGVMGRVFTRSFTELGHTVIEYDIKKGGSTLNALIKKSDVVLVAVPLRSTEKVLQSIAARLTSKQLLMDVASIKGPQVKAALTGRSSVIGLHPLFGGVHSMNSLHCVVCPARPGRWLPWLKKQLNTLGLHIRIQTPQKHDADMAVHQSLHHVVLITIAKIIHDKKISLKKLSETTTPSMRLTLLAAARLLSGNPHMYADIETLNPSAKHMSRVIWQEAKKISDKIEKDDGTLVQLIQTLQKSCGDFAQKALEETDALYTSSGNIKTAKARKQKADIAAVGPYSYSQLAAEKIKKKTETVLCVSSFHEVCQAALKGRVKKAVLPLENTSAGRVNDVMQLLFKHRKKLHITGEIVQPICHALAGNVPVKEATQVFAHHQAISQCATFLQKNMPQVEVVEAAHTGMALSLAKKYGALAIADKSQIKEAGLKVITHNIHTHAKNATHFVVVEKKCPPRKKNTETFLLVHLRKDGAGLLAAALNAFAKEGINLSQLESLPDPTRSTYYFFIRAKVGPCSSQLKRVTAEIAPMATVEHIGSV